MTQRRRARRPVAPYELVERIRASINVLGPLLTRCGEVRLSMPGGDDFGARPIDMHIAGLEAMGADVQVQPRRAGGDAPTGCTAPTSRSPFPSVGATENIVTAAVFANGVTTIDNAAREPEVVDLCEMLVEMGADIDGHRHVARRGDAASSGARCAPADHRTVARPHPGRDLPRRASPSPAASSTVRDARPEHMQNLLARFADMGLEFDGRARLAAGRRRRSAALDRRADAAVPRHRHRLQAADHHDAQRRRRRRHRHREPVPGPLPLRRGADPPRRRHPHQRPPRRRARRAPPVGGAGAGPRHPGRGGDGGGRAGRRGRDRRSAASATSTAATTTSSAAWQPSAPASRV